MTNRLKIIVLTGGLLFNSSPSFAMDLNDLVQTLAITSSITMPLVMKEVKSHGLNRLLRDRSSMTLAMLSTIPPLLAPWLQFNKRQQQGNQRGSKWWYAAPTVAAGTLALAHYYYNRDPDLFFLGIIPTSVLAWGGYVSVDIERARDEGQRLEAERRDEAARQAEAVQRRREADNQWLLEWDANRRRQREAEELRRQQITEERRERQGWRLIAIILVPLYERPIYELPKSLREHQYSSAPAA